MNTGWWRKYVEEAHVIDHPDWTRPGSLEVRFDRAGLRQEVRALGG